jgi:transposase
VQPPPLWACGPTDLRKSFDTLAGVVRNHLGRDPLGGQLFVFCNRQRNRVKILFWDQSGYWVCAKRLERGTFDWPPPGRDAALELTQEQMAILLGGLEWRGMGRRKWLGAAPASPGG